MTPERPGPIFPHRGGSSAALFGVIATMSFLACLTLAAALTGARLASAWALGLSATATVQIEEHSAVSLEAQTAAAMQILQNWPGISAARALSREDSEALLRPWLGEADLSLAPVPQLIALTLDPAQPVDAKALSAALTAAAPGARYDDHGRWNRGLTAASRGVILGAFLILAVIAAASGASIAFAARARLQAHHEIVDVLHLIGAPAAFIARELRWRFARMGAEAGLAGALAAVLILLAARAWAERGEALGLEALIPAWRDLLWCLTVPPLAGFLAAATAHWAVMRGLSRTQ